MADPVPVVGDLYQVTFKLQAFNQVCLNTFHYRLESLGGRTSVFVIQADLIGFMQRAADIQEKFLAVTPSNVTLQEIWCQRISAVRVRKTVADVFLDGTADEEAQTANVAASIERRGDLASRQSIGRLQVMIPGGTVWQIDGHITAAAELKLNALADLLPAGETGAPGTAIFAPVLVRRSGLSYTYQPITAAGAMFTTRTMRSRTVGHGK